MNLENLSVLILACHDGTINLVRQRLADGIGSKVLLDSTKTKKSFLKLIKEKSYDVILAEDTLPGYTAIAALKACRQLCPGTPFICLSGTIGEDTAVDLIKNGAADYVSIDRPERLPSAVSRAIAEMQERKAHELTLALSEESNKLMLDATSDGIAMFDQSGTILNVNQAFAGRLERQKEHLVGRSLREVFPAEKYGERHAQWLARIRQVYETGKSAEFEDQYDGRWMRNRFFPNYINGSLSAVTVFSFDNTNIRKIAEEESRNRELQRESEMLRAKERDYLEIIDSSTIGTWIYDFETGELKYSSQWLERIGGADDDSTKWLMIVNIIYQTNEACAAGKSKFKIEYSLKTKDGRTMWILDQGKILFNDHKRPWKIYGTSMDITYRKAYEQELQLMADELEQKNKLITNFFINLSHEFKTPISIILLAVEIMEMYRKHNIMDQEKIDKQVAVLKQNAYRLGRLVGNLLDITKIDAGFMSPNWSSVDIVRTLQSLVSSMRHLTQSKGLNLCFISTARSMVMPSDPQFIERIVLNLISNSIKHTEAGGFIRINCYTFADKIVISVRDSGVGIPEDKKDIIFDRFRQVNTSLTRSSEGCGIGLALSKSLVEMLSGRIWFESKPGVGTCFYVELPVLTVDISRQKTDTNGMDVNTRIQMEFSDIDF